MLVFVWGIFILYLGYAHISKIYPKQQPWMDKNCKDPDLVRILSSDVPREFSNCVSYLVQSNYQERLEQEVFYIFVSLVSIPLLTLLIGWIVLKLLKLGVLGKMFNGFKVFLFFPLKWVVEGFQDRGEK